MELIVQVMKTTFRVTKFVQNKTIEKLQKNVENSRKINSLAYKNNPNVTVILQFFNKRRNIKQIIERLRLTAAEEIIVIDDGSIDGSYKDWLKHLNQPNDFLLRCNDLFEVRTYDRAIGMARGKYICLLQDDDIPPISNSWIEQAITLFDTFPKLLILGGRNGLDILIPDPVDMSIFPQYKRCGDIAGCPGINKYKIYDTPLYIDHISSIPFMFTMAVNRAPMFLRKEQFLQIGGINQAYAPFQCDDVDVSIRAWLAGYQVGMYNCPFTRDVGVGGMRLFNKETVSK